MKTNLRQLWVTYISWILPGCPVSSFPMHFNKFQLNILDVFFSSLAFSAFIDFCNTTVY